MVQHVNGKFTTREGERIGIERERLRIPLFATDFSRYRFAPRGEELIIFPYRIAGKQSRLLSEAELRADFPNTFLYLKSQKNKLLARKQYKEWYGFRAPRNLEAHENADIMIPLLADRGLCGRLPTDMKKYCPMASGGFTIGIPRSSMVSAEYVLGLLNSTLLFWQLKRISNIFHGGWVTCTKQYVGTLPIRKISQDNNTDVQQHDLIVERTRQMLDLHARQPKARTEHERTALARQIEHTDAQIDRLEYELYGLTEDEIALVEEATK